MGPPRKLDIPLRSVFHLFMSSKLQVELVYFSLHGGYGLLHALWGQVGLITCTIAPCMH